MHPHTLCAIPVNQRGTQSLPVWSGFQITDLCKFKVGCFHSKLKTNQIIIILSQSGTCFIIMRRKDDAHRSQIYANWFMPINKRNHNHILSTKTKKQTISLLYCLDWSWWSRMNQICHIIMTRKDDAHRSQIYANWFAPSPISSLTNSHVLSVAPKPKSKPNIFVSILWTLNNMMQVWSSTEIGRVKN